MSSASQVEAAARQLQEENRRIKERVNSKEDELKRTATRVKKKEEEVAAQAKNAAARAGVKELSAGDLKSLAAKDGQIKKLAQQVREKEKQNQALERHITLFRHSFPQQQPQKGAASARRPLLETPNRGAQKQPGAGSPTKAGGKAATHLMSGADEEDQQRLVIVLEGELERSCAHLKQLRNDLAQKSKHAKDVTAAAPSASESVTWLRKQLKDMSARLTVLLSTQERTRTAFREEEEMHSLLLKEVESLNEMLVKVRQESQGLSREKEILQLRKGETADDMEKHMKEIRKELEEVDADNRKLREQAFKTGGDMVSVRVTEDDFRVKQEENRALKDEIADLKAKVEQLQASVDEAERGEQGSVKMMEQNLSTLDREAQQLHKETDRLREKVESLAAQQGIGAALVLPAATASKARGGGAQDRSKEVRRLRRENAQHVREIRKAEQEMQLHKLLIRESEQLQADLDQHIGAVSLAHKKKAQKIQRKLSLVEMHNERLRTQLRDLQQGKAASGGGGGSASASIAAAVPSPAAAARAVVDIVIDGLVLEPTLAALEGSEEPRTMLLLDFFLHDTQYSTPLVGHSPRGRLARSFETAVDQLLMHYLYTDALRIQLVRIVGLDAEPLGECNVALDELVSSASQSSLELRRVQLLDATGGRGGLPRTASGAAAGRVVGHLNVAVKMQAASVSVIKDAARTFMAHAPEEGRAVAPVERQGLLELKEEMERRIGAMYTLRVSVSGLSGARSKMPVVAMFQLLDADVCATDPVMTSPDGTAVFSAGSKCALKLETTQSLDKRLLSQAMDVCLFDDSEAAKASENGLLGAGHVLLAPLLHRRGISGTVQLRSPDPSNTTVVASLTIDVSWDPEPIGGAAVAEAASAAASGKPAAAAAAASWEVRCTLWKMRNWAESANMGTGVPAFQAVFEVLMDAARELVPAAQLRPDGLTAAMFEKALVKEGGAQLALPAAHLELTHMHVAADASVITKEKFLNALVTALDPGPQPRAAESPVKAGGAGGIEEDVPAGGEEIEESSVLK